MEGYCVQREAVLETALLVMEREGLATITLDHVAGETGKTVESLQLFWPNREALIYDALRYHSQQIETHRRQLLLDDTLSDEQKLLARYKTLTECVAQQRYPGCLFIAACSFWPDAEDPIHQLATEQKRAAWEYTHTLLNRLDVDDPAMVADQMELVLEGCLSKLLVKRHQEDVDTAARLAQDILRFAQCRQAGALT
jgi:AcrR family transcriptional regulator